MEEHLFEDSRGLKYVKDVAGLCAELQASRRLAAYMALNLVAAIWVRNQALEAILRLFEGDARSDCAEAARRERDALGRTLGLIRGVHPDLVPDEALAALTGGRS
jgi:hypothetical protein